MRVREPYGSPKAVESAIKQAAQRATASDDSLSVGERIRLEYFNRLLARIFTFDSDSQWVLKGGYALLARVPSSRGTIDIDLMRDSSDINSALDDLIRLAGIGMGDHFEFRYAKHRSIVREDIQSHINGYRVTFDVLLGRQPKGQLSVDFVVGTKPTAPVEIVRSASSLDLPRLPQAPYRVFPLIDHLADKVCATMQTYGANESTREKDLVDIVIIGMTQEIVGAELSDAIRSAAARNRLSPFSELRIPTAWGFKYGELAQRVPYCAEFISIDKAKDFVKGFIDPVLAGEVDDATWVPGERAWIPDMKSDSIEDWLRAPQLAEDLVSRFGEGNLVPDIDLLCGRLDDAQVIIYRCEPIPATLSELGVAGWDDASIALGNRVLKARGVTAHFQVADGEAALGSGIMIPAREVVVPIELPERIHRESGIASADWESISSDIRAKLSRKSAVSDPYWEQRLRDTYYSDYRPEGPDFR